METTNSFVFYSPRWVVFANFCESPQISPLGFQSWSFKHRIEADQPVHSDVRGLGVSEFQASTPKNVGSRLRGVFFFSWSIFVGEDDRKGMTTAKEKTKSQIPRKCWVLKRWLLLNMATLRIIQSQVTCGLEIKKKSFKKTDPNPFVSVVSYPGFLGHCWISRVYNHSWGPFIPAHFCWDGRHSHFWGTASPELRKSRCFLLCQRIPWPKKHDFGGG